jgi:signal transduction histidine kinase
MRVFGSIRAAQSLDDTLAAAVGEARTLLATHVAVLRVERGAGRTSASVSLSSKYATLEQVPWSGLEHLEAPLVADDGSALGDLKVTDPIAGHFGASDAETLAQIAEITAFALERPRQTRPTTPRCANTCDDIVAMVSHDLRSPLNMIAMSAGLLRRDVAGGGLPLLDTIERSVTRMNTLISDLGDAGSIAEHSLTLALRPERVTSIVWDAVDAVGQLAASSGCTIETRAPGPPDEEIEILADRPRLSRVLFHLVRNAIQSSPAGGQVTVGVEVEHGVETTACFFVVDGGRGIPADRMAGLFERYPHARSESRKGIGLGLFVARGIVEAHGGHLQIESELAAGTRAVFAIPRAR